MMFPTEAERLARLHKRAGCGCTEDESMPIDLDHIRESIDLEIPTDPEVVLQLVDEVEHLRSKYIASQEEMTEVLIEHRKLIEALEKIANDYSTTCAECIVSMCVATVALGRPCP